MIIPTYDKYPATIGCFSANPPYIYPVSHKVEQP